MCRFHYHVFNDTSKVTKKWSKKERKKMTLSYLSEGDIDSQSAKSVKTQHQEKQRLNSLLNNYYKCQKLKAHSYFFLNNPKSISSNLKIKKNFNFEKNKTKKAIRWSCFWRKKHPFLLFFGFRKWGNQDLAQETKTFLERDISMQFCHKTRSAVFEVQALFIGSTKCLSNC